MTFAPTTHRLAACDAATLCAVLDRIDHTIDRDSARDGVPLAVLLSAVGRRSYGPLLLIMGVFAVSPLTIVPGVTILAALVTLAIALQMAVGSKRPWLPRRMLAFKVPRRPLFRFIDGVRPHAAQADGVWLKPRLQFLCDGPCAFLVAVCVAAAALITIPLSLIPFGPVLPSLAVVLFGLGMTARDGALVGVGMGVILGSLALALPLMPHAI